MSSNVMDALLLQGVNVETDEVYATKLESVASIAKPKAGYLWKSAEEDAATLQLQETGAMTLQEKTEFYVTSMQNKLNAFSKSSHVTDREIATEKLKQCTKNKAVHILLGGKSTGKTKVLQNFCKNNEDDGLMLAYVNGREDSLKQGLKNALQMVKIDEHFWEDFNFTAFIGGLGICGSASIEGVDLALRDGVGETVRTVADFLGVLGGASMALRKLVDLVFAKALDPTEGLVRIFLTLAEKKKKTPCLIIDEANLVIKGKDTETQKLIGMILRVTKEEMKMSCILCSSQHSYPQALQEGGLQLDLARIVFLPELSPQAMWFFLTKEKYKDSNDLVVGMGKHLAKHLISVCGGRIAFMAGMVTEVCDLKEEYCVNDTLFLVEGANKVHGMLKPEKQSEHRNSLSEKGLKNLVKLLHDLSRQGYCKVLQQLDDYDSLIRILVDEGVAGMVQRNHFLHKDSRKMFGEIDGAQILVPSSASLRLVIAAKMKMLEVDTPLSPCK